MYSLKYYYVTLKTTKNTGGSILTIFGRSDFVGIFLKEMDFRRSSRQSDQHGRTLLTFFQIFLSRWSLVFKYLRGLWKILNHSNIVCEICKYHKNPFWHRTLLCQILRNSKILLAMFVLFYGFIRITKTTLLIYVKGQDFKVHF